MKVKPGYKQTEVGVIPEDWAVKRLGELFEVTSSRRVFQSEWRTQGVPFYRARELAVLGEAGFVDNELFISRDMYEDFKSRHGIPAVGDMLVTGVGTLGKTYVVLGDHEFYFKDGNIIWFKIGSDLSAQFLRQLYLTPLLIKQIANGAAGTTVGTYTIAAAKKTAIPFPPLPEQRAIAEALSDVDALIESLDRLIAKKRDIKQAAMQQLLTGQRRLPGFSGEWEVGRLGDVGTWKGGMTPSMRNPDYWHGGDVPWVSSGDVKSVVLSQSGYSVTAQAVKQGKTTLMPPNSILVVTRSGILRRYLPVATNLVSMAINQDIKAVTPHSEICPTFLLHSLIWHGDEIIARCMKSGTTVESIEFRWLKAFSIPLPPLREQAAIAEVLSDMDSELAALEQRRDKTRALKQGMMQELLTGRTRLI